MTSIEYDTGIGITDHSRRGSFFGGDFWLLRLDGYHIYTPHIIYI
jgi:hypothetical protein